MRVITVQGSSEIYLDEIINRILKKYSDENLDIDIKFSTVPLSDGKYVFAAMIIFK